MTCQAAQELILESLDCRIDEEQQIRLESHLAQCEMCRSFREAQRELDAALAAHCVAPQLSPAFRSKLAHKIRREKRQALQEWLPDLLHLGGGIVATTACFCGCLLHPPWSLPSASHSRFSAMSCRRCFASGWKTWKGCRHNQHCRLNSPGGSSRLGAPSSALDSGVRRLRPKSRRLEDLDSVR